MTDITRFIIHGTLVFIVFGAYSYMQYNDQIKESNLFYVCGIILGLMSTLLWLSFVKTIDVKHHIIFYTLMWNLIVMLAFYSVPVILYKIPLSPTSWLGLAMSIGGIVVFRLSNM